MNVNWRKLQVTNKIKEHILIEVAQAEKDLRDGKRWQIPRQIHLFFCYETLLHDINKYV